MGSIAPLISRPKPPHWRFLPPAGVSAGIVPSPGPNDPIGLTVELYLGALGWSDVSAFVLYRNSSQLVGISRGTPNEGVAYQAQTATLQINNRGDQFNPRNPTGPYYGLIGRNTPIRISRLQNGVRRYRFTGEVVSWPSTADLSGNDVYADLTAAGQWRRLNQGTPPVRSAFFRALVSPLRLGEANVVAYWPMEDGSGATQFASALSGAPAMTVAATGASPASYSTWNASQALPTMNGAVLSGSVPAYTSSNGTNLRWQMLVPSGGTGATRNVIAMYGTGTVHKWLVQVDSSGSLILTGYDVTGTQLFTSGAVSFAVNGKDISAGVQLTQSGANVNWNISAIDVTTYAYASGVTVLNQGGTLTGRTVGVINSITVGDNAGLGSTAMGHVALGNQIDAFAATANAMGANAQEPVFTPDALTASGGFSTQGRFLRLCTEMGINGAEVYGSVYTSDAVSMGPQLPETYPNLIQQCADSDAALLFEARDQLSLMLRSRLSLYNQAAKLTLDVAQNQLSAQPVPVDDDYYTRNDVTVTRITGSSANQRQTTGTLSSQQPPAGVGDYSTTYTISLGDDSQTADQAGWRLHMGTVDEPRYPSISVNLRYPSFTGSMDLMNAALTIDIGDVIEIDNPPAWLSANPIRLIVLGYRESMGVFEHEIVFNTAPQSPYRVFIADDPVLGRADTDGSTLAATYPLGTETTLLVATAGATSPLWTTSAGDFPFDVAVGGERMTVTNITGSSSPQAFTVTRSVNGVVKPQAYGADVRLWQPAILSL